MKQAVFIYDEAELKYRFHDKHPFNQKRLKLTVDLLREANALDESDLEAARPAEPEELLLVHTPEYIEAVQRLSEPAPAPEWIGKAHRYGLDADGDTPYFVHMHEATSRIVGGSLKAAEWVMSGRSRQALHLGGGLHHALPGRGSGFCVYNDAAVAIAYIRRHYGARVLYIDTDVHHGDGVQWSFYSEPNVCTFSIHETGKYLFPGTGEANERGEGEAFGSAFNVPLEPYTEDDSWLECFREAAEKIAAHFKPDVIVSQHGCDAHAFDPLAHIQCSMRLFLQIPLIVRQLAETWCRGRWIALGGGGYDIWRVVPRAWSLLWMTMSDHPLIGRLTGEPLLPLPASWLEKWRPHSPLKLPATWLDDTDCWEPIPRRRHIEEENRRKKEIALLYLS